MHLLMTTDTVGGVWTYTQELVTGLLHRGHRLTLISMGGLPTSSQTEWMMSLSKLDYRPTAYRLEWMQDAEQDIDESRSHLQSVIAEVNPDVLHFNQYCYGDLSSDLPRIVVAHSDVVSWWVEVHGHEPETSAWNSWYRTTVERGLKGADCVVAPTKWMLDAVHHHYDPGVPGTVIYNGRSPELFDPDHAREGFVLSVGRLWDKGKQVNLLSDHQQVLPVCIAGCEKEPGSNRSTNLNCLGEQSPGQLRNLFARAAMYVGTSRYEPFGLSPLEAALSRCALVLNDTPAFREVWGDSACYFRANDAHALADTIRSLSENPQLRGRYAESVYSRAREKFTADRMVEQYERLYSSVAAMERIA